MSNQNQLPQNIKFDSDGNRYVRPTDELDINNTNFDAYEDYRVHKDLLNKVNEAWTAEDTKRGIGRIVARRATQQASDIFDRHNAMIMMDQTRTVNTRVSLIKLYGRI